MKITIFGLAGTGTTTVGKELARTLGYTFRSTGDALREIAERQRVSLAELHERMKRDRTIDALLDKETLAFGEANNNFVYDGRLAWHFIPDSWKVKLYCSDMVRFRRIAEREQKSYLQVEEETLQREYRDRIRYLQYYGIHDIENDSHFNMTLDTAIIRADGVVGILATELAHLQES